MTAQSRRGVPILLHRMVLNPFSYFTAYPSRTLSPFQSLRNPVFARLYAAQTTSLFGDALACMGLALLAFELATYEFDSGPLRLENVNSSEVDYRAQLTKQFYVDVDYFYSIYNDFIVSQNFLGNMDGTRPTAAQIGASAAVCFQSPCPPRRCSVPWWATPCPACTPPFRPGAATCSTQPTTRYTGRPALAVSCTRACCLI